MIKIKFFAVCFFFLVSSKIFSQTWNHYDWEKADKFSDTVFNKAKDFYVNQYKNNIYVGDMNNMKAKDAASFLYTDYKRGNIYTNFYNYEAYIKQVLAQILQNKAEIDKIKVFFYYESEFNMTMDVLGNIRVYVGLFNYINNEAELAGILAHEYGHLRNKDGINNHTSDIQQEAAADYMAIKLIKNSGYSSKGMSSCFKIFKRFEIKYELRHGNNTFTYDSHPDPGDRLKQVKILSKDSNNIGKKLFLVDSVKFFQLKRIASQESYNILMGFMQYHDVMELAFRDYLYHPDDMENLALLIESIRRYIAKNPEIKDKQFIIDYYKGKGAKRSDNYNFVDDDKTSILRYLNKGLLHLPSNDLSKIKALDILDSLNIKFTSYKEAYTYFLAKAKDVHCQPCLFVDIFKDEKKLAYDQNAVNTNTIFDCSGFLNDLNSPASYSENMIVVNLPHFTGITVHDTDKTGLYTKMVQTFMETVKTKTGFKNIYLITELPFHDQHQIDFINNLSEGIVDPGFYNKSVITNAQTKGGYGNLAGTHSATKTSRSNWRVYAPECYEIFSKYKVKNIYMVDFDLFNYTMAGLSAYGIPITTVDRISKSWKFKKASVDKLSATLVYNHKIAITKETKDESILDFCSDLKAFISLYK